MAYAKGGHTMSEPRVYRASSLGYSLCQLVCPHLGYEPASPPEWMQEKFDEGNRIEPLAIEKLRARGWMINVAQDHPNALGDTQIEVELEVIPDKVKVVGHLDGIALKADHLSIKSSIVEIKRMYAKGWEQFNDRGWDTPGLIQKYKWQASAYMLATGLPHIMVAWNADTEELTFKVVTEPFYSISDIALKLRDAEWHISMNTIPDGCNDFPCPYYFLHEEKDKKEVVDADDELETILSAWHEADKRAKIYEGEKNALRKQIIELVGSGDLTAPVIKSRDGVKVETYWQEGGEVVQKRTPKWVTKISGPRGK